MKELIKGQLKIIWLKDSTYPPVINVKELVKPGNNYNSKINSEFRKIS